MAKFDVHARHGGPGYLLDCQADLLCDLNTRFVVPLLPAEEAPRPAGRLNPVFEVRGQRVIMVTQFASAVLARENVRWCRFRHFDRPDPRRCAGKRWASAMRSSIWRSPTLCVLPREHGENFNPVGKRSHKPISHGLSYLS